MAKILRYTFKTPKLEIVDGELVENGSEEETYTFTLLHKAVGIYEELAGEPLLATLSNLERREDGELDLQKILSQDFVSNLAAASYVKIEDDKFHNNRATAEEFKKKTIYSTCVSDFNFIQKLIGMATDCMQDENVKNKISKGDKSPKK